MAPGVLVLMVEVVMMVVVKVDVYTVEEVYTVVELWEENYGGCRSSCLGLWVRHPLCQCVVLPWGSWCQWNL